MRAINLIPPDERPGAGGIAGRTGGAAYVLIAGLTALVILGIVYAFAVHDVASRKTTLARVTAEAAVVSSQVTELQPYVAFRATAESRIGNVASLAEQRFDWARAMQQIALALPSSVTLGSLSAAAGAATVGATGVTGVTGSTGVAAGNTAPSAAFNLQGCAPTQLVVAATLARVRRLQDVTSASVATYTKGANVSLQATSAVAFQPCKDVSWSMTVDYGSGYGIPAPRLPAGVSTTVKD